MSRVIKKILAGILGRKGQLPILTGPLRGMRFSIDPLSNLGDLLSTRREPYLQRALRRYLKPGDVVFDVGANWGFFTLYMSQLVGSQGSVIALEPVPFTAAILLRNLQANHISNVEVIQKAVSSDEGNRCIRIPEGGEGHPMASINWHKVDPDVIEITVKTISLDTFCSMRALDAYSGEREHSIRPS